MKLTKIALAMSAMMATPAVFAAAHSSVWLSGASAPTNSVFRGVIALCNGVAGNGGANDATMYLSGTGTEPGKSSGDWVAYSCTMSPAAGALDGKKMVVYHTVEGGSFNAYAPHISKLGPPDSSNTNLPGKLNRVANIAGVGAACTGGTLAASTNVTINGVTTPIKRYTGCSTVTKTFSGTSGGVAGLDYPDGGFSDTEYLMNKLNLGIITDQASIGSPTPTNVGQAFGVAVSYPLYYQLQKNDFGSTSTCVTGGSALSPVLTAACQPNMPAQRYTTVAAKGYSADASLFGGAVGGKVTLARRVITSGTQSTSNLRFLSNPCATGEPQGTLEPKRSTDSTATLVVNESSSTGGVKTVLNAATGAGEFALGWVSMENTPAPTATADRWAFVKLDRVSPNSDTQQRAEAMDGSYTAWYELEAFTAHAASTDGAELITQVTTTLGNTDLKGLFATPLAFATGPTSKGFRAGNSCQPAGQ